MREGSRSGEAWFGSTLLVTALLSLVLAACTPSTATGPRITGDYLPAGSHRLAQVVQLASRKEILEVPPLMELLHACGVHDEELRDGSVVMARIYCCGGPNESQTARMLYVPPGIDTGIGDIVEILVGSPPAGEFSGSLNTVLRIREKYVKGVERDYATWWEPINPDLWARVLYGDWMAGEGWVHQGGLYPAWYKPASAGRRSGPATDSKTE